VVFETYRSTNKQRKRPPKIDSCGAERAILAAIRNFLLVIGALRDKKPAEAKGLLSEWVREFPQNSMFRSEFQKLS
jgi:hypothetical protein